MSKSEFQIYQFGPFRLDASERILLRDNRTIHLTEKVFNILLLLVQRCGHLVTREELMEQVWPDSVVEDNNLTVSISALRKALGKKQEGGQYIETVSKRGYRFIANVQEIKDERDRLAQAEWSAVSSRIRAGLLDIAATTLAVLPLFNVSDDPNLEYLSDGITESIINSLSKLPQLKVLARSTVFRFKRSDIDPLEIGRQLESHALLTGRILQINEELIIKLELLNVKEGSQIWGEQYKRKSADIFEVQEEISQEVSEKLQLRLTGEQKRQLTKRYTENTEAYHLYLKGRYFWNKRTDEALNTGIEFFQQAIAKDPDYALAYTGLADSYAIIPFYSNLPSKPAFEEAKKATAKALEIDDTLAEAHASLGFVKEYYEWDWIGARSEYKKAIDLTPNYATAHQWYGMYFMKLGQVEKATRELKRALQLSPHSLVINADLGLPFYFRQQYDKAVEQYQKVLKMDQNFIWARYFLGWAYERSGEFAKAIAEFQKARLIDNRPEVSAMIGHTYAMSGRRTEAISILNSLEEQSKQHYISPYYIALIFAGLNDKEQAFRWLEQAYSDRNEWLVWLKVDPRFDGLHTDSRFPELLRRLGFTEGVIENHDRRSLAVLPLYNISNDPSLEYLSDGITESVINSLSRLSQLKVLARNTIFRYKGQKVDAQKIGSDLNVGTVLLGNINQLDNTLIVSTELIDVADGSQIWGEQYNQNGSDIFTVQEKIVKRITEALRLRLTGEERESLIKQYTDNPDAYQLYLKGRYFANKRTEEDIRKAIEYLKQAIEIDPGYALAYAALASCYNLFGAYGVFPPNEVIPKIKVAAEKALEIDDSLAEAHVSLGHVKSFHEWDWLGGETEFKLAIKLNPAYATAHHWYALWLRIRKKFDKSFAELQLAQRLDPLSLIISTAIAQNFSYLRQFDQAITQFRHVLELDPNFYIARSLLGLAYLGKGLFDEAITELEKALTIIDNKEALALLGYAFAVSGRRDEARHILIELQEVADKGYVDPSFMAIIHAALNEKDRAFEYLEKAYENRSEWLAVLNMFSPFDSLRTDPRFISLMRRIGHVD
jgi:TolB-like protein